MKFKFRQPMFLLTGLFLLLSLFASSCYYSRSMSGEGYEGGHVYLVKELGEASPYSLCPAEQDPMEYLKEIDTLYFPNPGWAREHYERLIADGYCVEDVYKFNYDKTENVLTLSDESKAVHYALYPGTLFRIKYFFWDFENGAKIFATVLNGSLAGKEVFVGFGRDLRDYVARFDYPAGGTYPCWEGSGRYRRPEMVLDPDLVEDLGEISDEELKAKGLWAEPGSAEAMRMGVKPLPEGIDLKQLESDALKNDVEAQIQLSKIYYEGLGVRKDEEKASGWLQGGISQGNRDAEFRLALMYADNWGGRGWRFRRAEEIFRKYAEQGDADAQFCLGLLLECGYERVRYSIPVDEEELEKWKESVVWYRKAADQGDARAMRALGMAYCEPDDTPFFWPTIVRVDRDMEQAAEWFRKAAELGDFAAQRNLGYLYLKGKGVKKDKAEARKWLEKAAAQGDIYATELLNEIK